MLENRTTPQANTQGTGDPSAGQYTATSEPSHLPKPMQALVLALAPLFNAPNLTTSALPPINSEPTTQHTHVHSAAGANNQTSTQARAEMLLDLNNFAETAKQSFIDLKDPNTLKQMQLGVLALLNIENPPIRIDLVVDQNGAAKLAPWSFGKTEFGHYHLLRWNQEHLNSWHQKNSNGDWSNYLTTNPAASYGYLLNPTKLEPELWLHRIVTNGTGSKDTKFVQLEGLKIPTCPDTRKTTLYVTIQLPGNDRLIHAISEGKDLIPGSNDNSVGFVYKGCLPQEQGGSFYNKFYSVVNGSDGVKGLIDFAIIEGEGDNRTARWPTKEEYLAPPAANRVTANDIRDPQNINIAQDPQANPGDSKTTPSGQIIDVRKDENKAAFTDFKNSPAIDAPSTLDKAWNWLVDKGSSPITLAGGLIIAVGLAAAGFWEYLRRRSEDSKLSKS